MYTHSYIERGCLEGIYSDTTGALGKAEEFLGSSYVDICFTSRCNARDPPLPDDESDYSSSLESSLSEDSSYSSSWLTNLNICIQLKICDGGITISDDGGIARSGARAGPGRNGGTTNTDASSSSSSSASSGGTLGYNSGGFFGGMYGVAYDDPYGIFGGPVADDPYGFYGGPVADAPYDVFNGPIPGAPVVDSSYGVFNEPSYESSELAGIQLPDDVDSTTMQTQSKWNIIKINSVLTKSKTDKVETWNYIKGSRILKSFI